MSDLGPDLVRARPLDPSPPGEPSDAPDAGASTDPAPLPVRNPWNVVLGVTLAVLVAAGVTVAWVAYNARSSAATVRAHTGDLLTQTSDAAAVQAADDQSESDISAADAVVRDDLTSWVQDYAAAEDPWNRWSDIVDQSVALHNQGSTTTATAKLQGDGASALAEFQQAASALDKSLTDLQTAVGQLKEADHG